MPADLDPRLLPLAGVVLLSFATGAATGFGSVIIALSLGLYLYPLHRLLPVLVLLDAVLSAYLVVRHRRHIAGAWLFGRILPLLGVGLAVGVALFRYAAEAALRVIFGGFVAAVAVIELNRLLRRGAAAPTALRPGSRAAGLLGAGVTHGLFASGGPLLVYVLGRSDLQKAAFRSTLAAVWLVLDAALGVTYLLTGTITAAVWLDALVLLPVVVPAIAAGEWVHGRIDERCFRIAVFVLLALIGASLVASA